MIPFIKSLYRFILDDFSIKKYLPIFIWVGFILYVGYVLNFDTWFDAQAEFRTKVFIMFLCFSISYYPVVFWLQYCDKLTHKLGTLFWSRSVFILILLSFTSVFSFKSYFLEWTQSNYSYLFGKLSSNLENIIIISVLLGLTWKFIWKKSGTFLWLKGNGKGFKIILPILLIIIPLVIIGFKMGGFDSYYPSFKPWKVNPDCSISSGIQMILFEVAYVLDFLAVEIVFRGMLILGMIQILGTNAILPMASMYVFLHFGKPFAETASSFMGGYVLGYLAYYTQSITTGAIFHIWLAIFMEIVALIYYYA